MPSHDMTLTALVESSTDASQWIAAIVITAGVVVSVTIVGPAFNSYNRAYPILRTLPSNRAIVYVGGTDNASYNGICDRYDGSWSNIVRYPVGFHNNGDNQPSVVDMCFLPIGETAYILVGTPNAFGYSFNQHISPQDPECGVWVYNGGPSTFVTIGHQNGFNGGNINNPNTVCSIAVRPGETPRVYIGHCECLNNATGFEQILDLSDGPNIMSGGSDDHDITYFMYGNLQCLQYHAEWSNPGEFVIVDTSGSGDYSLPNQTWLFSVDADLVDYYIFPGTLGVLSGAMGGLFFDGSDKGFISDSNGDIHIYQLTHKGAGVTEKLATVAGHTMMPRGYCIHDTLPFGAVGYTGGHAADGTLVWTDDGGETWGQYDVVGYGILGLDFGVFSPPVTSNLWPQSATFRDARGDVAVITFYTTAPDAATANTQGEALVGAIADLSNARLEAAIGAWTMSPIIQIPGTDATYNTIEVKGILAFVDAASNILQIEIPSPKEEIFLSNGEEIDTSNPGVIDSLAELLANNLAGRGGNEISSYLGGRRVQSRRRRRATIYQLNPDLDEPEE